MRRTHGNDREVRFTYGNFAAEPSPTSSNLGFGHPRKIEHLETVTPATILTREIGWDRVQDCTHGKTGGCMAMGTTPRLSLTPPNRRECPPQRVVRLHGH